MEELVKLLIEKGKTISTMESCTGGGIVNAITNVPNASKVIKYSAVTYANDFKIKMGVPKETIDKYTVYSMETAIEMAYAIQRFTGSDYGVGVTGKLKKVDENNPYGEDDLVYLAICEKDKENENNNYCTIIRLNYEKREDNKEQIINVFCNLMNDVLNKENENKEDKID